MSSVNIIMLFIILPIIQSILLGFSKHDKTEWRAYALPKTIR